MRNFENRNGETEKNSEEKNEAEMKGRSWKTELDVRDAGSELCLGIVGSL